MTTYPDPRDLNLVQRAAIKPSTTWLERRRGLRMSNNPVPLTVKGRVGWMGPALVIHLKRDSIEKSGEEVGAFIRISEATEKTTPEQTVVPPTTEEQEGGQENSEGSTDNKDVPEEQHMIPMPDTIGMQEALDLGYEYHMTLACIKANKMYSKAVIYFVELVKEVVETGPGIPIITQVLMHNAGAEEVTMHVMVTIQEFRVCSYQLQLLSFQYTTGSMNQAGYSTAPGGHEILARGVWSQCHVAVAVVACEVLGFKIPQFDIYAVGDDEEFTPPQPTPPQVNPKTETDSDEMTETDSDETPMKRQRTTE